MGKSSVLDVPILQVEGPPEIFEPLFTSTFRYCVLVGGRGSGKSYAAIDYLISKAISGKEIILCAREYQNSLADSVYALIKARIEALHLASLFIFIDNEIRCKATDTVFKFYGLKTNPGNIKSMQGITIVFIEEAQYISYESLDILRPTIRAKGSHVILALNPTEEDDPVYERFILGRPASKPEQKPVFPKGMITITANWYDNPYFKDSPMYDEMLTDYERDPVLADHIWGGQIRRMSEAAILAARVKHNASEADFEFTPEEKALIKFKLGCDWGSGAGDPHVLVRCFELKDCLYVDQEVYCNLELDELPDAWNGMPEVKDYTILCDSANPGNISFMDRRGFHTYPVEKYSGSVDDGIAWLRHYKQIIIHPRCIHTKKDCLRYSWKLDSKKRIQNVPAHAFSHSPDALRYALNEEIMQGSAHNDWLNFGDESLD